MTVEREQTLENANVFIYRIAPRTIIHWSKDKDGNDVGNIVFEVTKNTVVDGGLTLTEREEPLAVSIEEVASEFVNILQANHDGTPNLNGETIPLFGWQVALFIKDYFDQKWRQRQIQKLEQKENSEGTIPDLSSPNESPTEEEPIEGA